MGIFGVAYGSRSRAQIGLGIGSVFLVVAVAASVWVFTGHAPVPLLGTLIVAVLLVLDAWRQSKAGTAADEAGVRIYTGWRTQFIPWTEITDIRRSRIGPGVELDRGMGNQYPLPGIAAEEIAPLDELRVRAREANSG